MKIYTIWGAPNENHYLSLQAVFAFQRNLHTRHIYTFTRTSKVFTAPPPRPLSAHTAVWIENKAVFHGAMRPHSSNKFTHRLTNIHNIYQTTPTPRICIRIRRRLDRRILKPQRRLGGLWVVDWALDDFPSFGAINWAKTAATTIRRRRRRVMCTNFWTRPYANKCAVLIYK